MATNNNFLVVMLLSTTLSIALATSGTATYYTTYVPSSCYGYASKGTMIAAANAALFNNKGACGKICTVRCTGSTNSVPGCNGGGPIKVMIVDLCPGCGANQLDLSEQAFKAIGHTAAGRIKIDYTC